MGLLRKHVLTLGVAAVVLCLTVLVSRTWFPSVAALMPLAFAVAAEVLCAAAFLVFSHISAGATRMMVSAGAYTAIGLYLLISLSVSAVFTVYRGLDSDILVTAQAASLALLLVILTVLYSYGKRISISDQASLRQVAAMGSLEEEVLLMRDDPRNGSYRQQLSAIFEAIRSCDQSLPSAADEPMGQRIHDLRLLLYLPNAPLEKVNGLTNDILRLLHQRTLELRQTRKGSI